MRLPTHTTTDLSNCSFATLADLYQSMSREGCAPNLDELIKLAPHLEDEIRSQIPMIKMLDQALGSETEPKLQLPKVVAGCVLEEEIGRGGMGVVYRGHQIDLGREVAVKVLRLTEEMSDRSKRFELERHTMAKLEHPNIVPAYSFTQDEEYAYLVMKLVDGVGMNKLIDQQADYKAKVMFNELVSDWRLFAVQMATIADALHHAHQNDIIHRDVKPGNLILDSQGKVWLSDFGLAKSCDRALSCTGDVIGTPKYMAPEQLHGAADGRTDVYSFGLTMYELVTGQAARANSDGKQSRPEIVPVRYLNPEVPQDLADVIMKACQFQPDKRFQSAEELAVVLRRFTEGKKAERRSENRLSDDQHREQLTKKMKLAAIASGGMLIVALLVFVWIQFGSQPAPTLVDQQAVAKSEVNILDILADGDRSDAELGEKIRETFVQATEEMQVPEKEKREIVGEINVIYDQIKNGEIRHRELGELIDNYHDSNLSVATRIWRVMPVIVQLGFTDREQERADEILRRFAFLATKNRIPHGDASRMINALTGGQSLDSAEFSQWQFTREEIVQWLRAVDQATVDLMQPGEEATLAKEIAEVFSRRSNRRVLQEIQQHSDDPDKLLEMYQERLNGSR